MKKGILFFIILANFITAKSYAQIDTVDVFQADTVLYCHIDSIALDAGPGFATYSWNTGEETQVIFVSQSANYTVTVFDGTNFESTDCYFVNAKIEEQGEKVCYKEIIGLQAGPNLDFLTYVWSTGDSSFFTTDTILDSTTYYLQASFNNQVCYDSTTFTIFPRMYLRFEQPNLLCPGGECKGQAKATASGGLEPYHYNWFSKIDPGDSSYAIGLCEGQYRIIVSDGYGCELDTSYTVELFDMPDVEAEYTPDTVYITNPRAIFSFENKSIDSITITDWSWSFGDNTKSDLAAPVHYYQSTGNYDAFFKYTTIDGCQDSVPLMVPVKELELEVPNVFTPNGDGINDYFEIKKLENYVSNELVIYNRWGKKVYERFNYQNDWDGNGLEDGTYYFVIKLTGYFEDDEKYGSVMIIGGEKD